MSERRGLEYDGRGLERSCSRGRARLYGLGRRCQRCRRGSFLLASRRQRMRTLGVTVRAVREVSKGVRLRIKQGLRVHASRVLDRVASNRCRSMRVSTTSRVAMAAKGKTRTLRYLDHNALRLVCFTVHVTTKRLLYRRRDLPIVLSSVFKVCRRRSLRTILR